MSGRNASETLIDALRNPTLYGAEGEQVRLVETHISWVLLTGSRAYKIKKPVRLPFLDFTTLAARRHYCEEELRLNRRLAPDIYLRVVPIGGSHAEPQLDAQPAIEYAVEMREFPADARLDRCVAHREIGSPAIAGFAETLGRFHAQLPTTPPNPRYGTADAVLAMVARNLDETAAVLPSGIDTDDMLQRYLTGRDPNLHDALAERRRRGSIREGHGDLHLENLLYWQDRIVAFDALEFDPELRWIDVIDEAAFLVMDLIAHGRPDLAFCFLNRYLEITGDYAGLALVPFYMMHRALVRAKVRAIKAKQESHDGPADAERSYVDVARGLLPRGDRRLLITHGLSGSGKTTVTQRLVELLPAIRIRSDIERKRHFGLGERAHSGSAPGRGLYTRGSNEAIYAAMADGAETGLRAGFDVIVDATFLKQAQRSLLASVAERNGARLTILNFLASDRTLRERLNARQRQALDASEATTEVLEYQIRHRETLSPSEAERAVSIDSERNVPIERVLELIRAS